MPERLGPEQTPVRFDAVIDEEVRALLRQASASRDFGARVFSSLDHDHRAPGRWVVRTALATAALAIVVSIVVSWSALTRWTPVPVAVPTSPDQPPLARSTAAATDDRDVPAPDDAATDSRGAARAATAAGGPTTAADHPVAGEDAEEAWGAPPVLVEQVGQPEDLRVASVVVESLVVEGVRIR